MVFDDYTSDIPNVVKSSAVIMHLLPLSDYAKDSIYGFDVTTTGQRLETDNTVSSTIMDVDFEDDGRASVSDVKFAT